MVEKTVKANDDAPMEKVKVYHEDADTAIMKEDDQGIDYNIDEYLDDPSKHYLFKFTTLNNHQADFSELGKLSADKGGDDDEEDGDSGSESESDGKYEDDLMD